MAPTAKRYINGLTVARRRDGGAHSSGPRHQGLKAVSPVAKALAKRAKPRRPPPWSPLDRATLRLGEALAELSRARRAGEQTAGELDRYTQPVRALYDMLLAWPAEPAR